MDLALVESVAEAKRIIDTSNAQFMGLFLLVSQDFVRQPNISEDCRMFDFYPRKSTLTTFGGTAMAKIKSGFY